MINYFCSVYISSSKHYEGPGGTEGGGGEREGVEVEIDNSTFNLPMKTALCFFFFRKTSLMKDLFVFSRLQRSST